jgi:hypothetical protein
VGRKHIKAAMRGARVLVEKRLDGSLWMQWRDQVLALEPCPATNQVPFIPAVRKRPATSRRSTQEKARAKQRLLNARRQWRENYERLRNRPIWQAMRDARLPAHEFS